ncbi:MAG: ribosome small subunit-dependent GTPase A [Chloroflexi bacterium]|nr:ribosome small subunit-dependent GTPase A [Chloroflexota bacterium]
MPISRGLVVRSQSGFYAVETDGRVLLARLRGRLKQGKAKGDLVAVGDWVLVTEAEAEEPRIESVEPRRRALVRRDPRPQGLYEQVIVANLDQALFIFSCADPAPKLHMLDRFLVIAEAQKFPAVIIANKVDLLNRPEVLSLFGHYAGIGYPTLYTSAKTGEGIQDFRDALKGKLTVLAGPSGVGKSTLMNAIQPGLSLRVNEIQQGSRKGKHTTVERLLFKLDIGGYVADTPGLKALALWDIQPEELDGYFPEMRGLVSDCKYGNCAHIDELGCAIRKAVEDGRMHPSRYESYKLMRLGE